MQIYRSPRWLDILGGVIAPVFFVVIGFGEAADLQGSGPAPIAVGAGIAAMGIYLAISQLRHRLVVTQDGLTWSFLLRTRTVVWADVQDIDVVRGYSSQDYYSPGIRTATGMVRVTCILGRRDYIEKVVSGIRTARPATRSRLS